MKNFDFTYWKKELENGFKNRDKLGAKNYFVIRYMQCPPPADFVTHQIMNFKSFEKAVGFIKNVIVRNVVADTLGLDFETAMLKDYTILINAFVNAVPDEDRQAARTLLELESIADMLENDARNRLMEIRENAEHLFDHCATNLYGMEIVFPDDDLADFWKEFFALDTDDEDDAEELNEVKRALISGDTELLDELISYH